MTLEVRTRMLDVLERTVSSVPLTVLTAPHGFGKTHLVDAWACSSERRIVVVELHAGDTVTTFGRALLDAIAAAGMSEWLVLAEERRALAVGDPQVADRLLADLSGRVGAVLVVDAVDAPHDGEVQDRIAALLRAAAGPLPVVVTRRSRRPNGLAEGSWSSAVRLIDHDELAFSADEAAALVHHLTGRRLDATSLGALMDLTLGWPRAVALLAARMPAIADPATTWDLAVQEVADQMAQSVLATLPLSAAQFLVATSVLDRMDPGSCDAVTGDSNGRVSLRMLERHGAPVWRTDPQGRWYRSHPLLREGLRRMLRQRGAAVEQRALHGAARWFSQRNRASEAAGYLIAADDWPGVVELADRHGRRMFETSATPELVEWLEAVPHGAVADLGGSRPTRTLRLAVAHTMMGNTRRCEQLLADLTGLVLTEGEQLVVDALRASRVYIDGDPSAAVVAADRVLAGIDVRTAAVPRLLGMTSRSMLAQIAHVSRTEAQWLLGEVAEAEARFTQLLADGELPYPPWAIHATGSLALLEAWAGHLTSAHEHARAALHAARSRGLERHVCVAHATLAAGHVIVERSASPVAGDLFEDALTVMAPLRRPITRAIYAVERAAWCLATGAIDDALATLEWQRLAGEPPPPPIVDDRMRAVEARAHLDAGRPGRAEAVLAAAPRPSSAALAPVRVRLAAERDDLDGARAALGVWEPATTDVRNQLDHDVWHAIIEFESGKRAAGLRGARDVVVAAGAESHHRVFLDAGPLGRRLLAALPLRPHEGSAAPMAPAGSEPLLSPREIEVLRYLSTPMSNAEIAAHLFISVNTLKTHLRAVYRKLDVPGRPEAAARAQARGIA